jgi:glycosyltransferase involved in cell wall biosynthesis
MKISIITVCYNSASTISDTITSVTNQTYNNIEYIFVDGGSKDGTMDIVTKYKDNVHHVICEPDKGLYDAMNKGINVATGDVIGILNSDDFYESETVIEDIVDAFNQRPLADMVFGDVVFVSPNDLGNITRTYSSKNFKRFKLRFGWMPPHPATFIRSSVYKKYGDYKLNFNITADYELFVRLLMVEKLQYSRINQVLVRMRTGGASTAGIKSSILLNLEIVKACKMNDIYTNIFLVLLKIPLKLLELIRK